MYLKVSLLKETLVVTHVISSLLCKRRWGVRWQGGEGWLPRSTGTPGNYTRKSGRGQSFNWAQRYLVRQNTKLHCYNNFNCGKILCLIVSFSSFCPPVFFTSQFTPCPKVNCNLHPLNETTCTPTRYGSHLRCYRIRILSVHFQNWPTQISKRRLAGSRRHIGQTGRITPWN